MCGISGIWSQKNSQENLRTRLRQATDSIAHRGPDNEGHWFDETCGLGLGHRRLSILDLSHHGFQPMFSPSKRYVIVFNGEIYNHLSLREELLQVNWQGTSDTETVLAAFEAWGIKNTLQKLYGMFAFALFDREKRALILGRDRMGEKPLYYGFKEGEFLFASELKPLFSMTLSPFTLNQEALFAYFRYTYVPTPGSILEGIYKLKPGHILTLREEDFKKKREPESEAYWELPKATDNQISLQDNKQTLEILLKSVVQDQMLSDVPLGVFLSGGIDSSLIVSIMQSVSQRPIKTFSIGFYRKEFNEAPYAKAVAKHLKTDHTELYITEKDAQNVIPTLSQIYDEPFSDSSQIPTFLVSQLAQEHVTVSLSGDGGDELFGGYDRYILAGKFYKRINPLPQALKGALSFGLRSLPSSLLNSIGYHVPKCPQQLGDKLYRASQMLRSTPEAFYERMMWAWASPPMIVSHETISQLPEQSLSYETFWTGMMQADLHHYLPDDILAKVDRAAMATSLETRVPFLDPRIVEFSQALPFSQKFYKQKGKHILRDILYSYVPQKLVDRPKRGFGVPIAEWMRGALLEWGADLLSDLTDHPYLDTSMIWKTWDAHQLQKTNATTQLWSTLMYLSWYKTYKPYIAVR